MQVFSETFSDRASRPVGPQTASRSSAATSNPATTRLPPALPTNLFDHLPVEILAEQSRPVGVA
ncbi:hypothetical protein A4G28_25570 [Mycobacterium ostraviense]|uniref:Uncharacterized protein n=1 Tax=Mycobacterium ostraviense TaxID=2738409 RepID=A0A163ZCG7_9MYCO|nr:hypothetical protein A4G28_25570 [Mycobacterium ostraviense]